MRTLADRMKMYEGLSEQRLMPRLPAMARLDGRCFSAFTKKAGAFYAPFIYMMDGLTAYLVKETEALAGYTQSDEITLCWHKSQPESDYFFGGRVQKMTSMLGALASTWMNTEGRKFEGPSGAKLRWTQPPLFDARVWNVPDLREAANVFLWRQRDCVRNSVTMQARRYFSFQELLHKNVSERKRMLLDMARHLSGLSFSPLGLSPPVAWEGLSRREQYGLFVQRVRTRRRFTTEEVEKLPLRHQARTNPNLEVVRTDLLTHTYNLEEASARDLFFERLSDGYHPEPSDAESDNANDEEESA